MGSQSVQCSTYSVCQLFFSCEFGAVTSVSQSTRVSEIVPGETSLITQFFFNPVRQGKKRDRWTWINYMGTGGDGERARSL